MSKARELSQRAGVDGALSNRNLIINGAMQVAQRGTSATGVTVGGYHTCDRWVFDIGASDTGTWTVTQEVDGPSGFSKSLKIACTTAKADISADWRFINLQQRIEGQNVTQTKFGTSDAESLTVSFWVKSNKTGTYTAEIANENAGYRQSAEFTIASSAAWEKKTITVGGDAAHGFASDNGASLYLIVWAAAAPNLSSGSLNTTWSNSTTGRVSGSNVNLADTIGNYFQITGVQLEVGDTATPFEHRSFGQELALCQRYYQADALSALLPLNAGSTLRRDYIRLQTPMRAIPSVSFDDGNGNASKFYRNGVNKAGGFADITKTYLLSTSSDGVASSIDDLYFVYRADAEL